MTVVNTNISAVATANALAQNSKAMQKTMQSLSTGSRINSSADDAAGLAIRENMNAQINGLKEKKKEHENKKGDIQ